MDCDQFRELLADLDRPGVLDPEVRARALMHGEDCADCGQLLTESESLDASLRALAARDENVLAAARLESRLVAAFRDRKAAARRQSRSRFAAVAGIAAVLLLAFGLWTSRVLVGRNHLPNVSSRKPLIAEGPPAEVVQPQRETTAAGKLGNGRMAGRPTAGSTGSSRRTVASSGSSEVTDADTEGAFIPLPDADDPAPLEDGAVVRVEMPRAALASFGLPVAAMEGDGTVRVDLVVSADGTPQAIRLVSADNADAGWR